MNNKNMWIACLAGGVITTLVSNFPILGLVNCMVCAGFWGSAMFAVWLYRRLEGSLTVRQGVIVGLLTGVVAGLLGFLVSLVGLAGVEGLLNAARPFMPPESIEGMEAIPAWAGMLMNVIGIFVTVAFCTLGGYLGGLIFRTDRPLKTATAR